MGAFDSFGLSSDDGSTQNFDSTGSSSLDLGGTTFGGQLDSGGGSSNTPASAPNTSSGGSLFDSVSNFVNLGLGVYKSVNSTSAQQSGQPEKTPDGRYVANIQGKPTVLQPDASAQSMQLLLVGAIVIGAVLLLRHRV